jgi:nitrite reductase/ring-hydroxylating ferredoxin subunit
VAKVARHAVGAEADFAPGVIKIVEVGAQSIGVMKSDGAFYAVLNVCPHALAPVCRGDLTGTMLPSAAGEVEYGLDDRVLRCPWHGYEFDVTTGLAVFTNFRGKLRTLPAVVEDGVVFVEVKERRQ